MNISQLVALVGHTGTYQCARPSVTINVTVCDVKVAYGKAFLLISPVSGEGSDWVEAGHVKIDLPEQVPYPYPSLLG